ncbi:J domain-containing protein [Paenibacillus sp. IB182496]|uniref:J domain-containing protein n=1 Tax=Paenibacillus sabuli TaxID=2772509 RepID=A0A927BSD1_9BACL|nr:J domain-containing protein [Paenibacillus sabuli]MBD2844795.1 J domain-containing protein [Paenibacillus sabuli]
MDELKQAYERLGLLETADKAEVEKRYMLLVRKHRAQEAKSDGELPPGEERIDFAAVNAAYKHILAHEDQQAAEAYNRQEYGKYRKMAGVAQKTDHFFSYYKYHLLGAVVILVLIGFGINSYLDRQAEKEREAALPPIDVSVMLHGQFYSEDGGQETAPLEQALLDYFPDWQRLTVDLTYVPIETRSEMDMAAVQKAVLMLISEKKDVYILDRNSYTSLVQQGLLRPIDEAYEERFRPLLDNEEAALRTSTEDVPEEHVYAIDLTNSPHAEDLPLIYQDMVVGIRIDAQRPDNAVRFIERMLEDAPPQPRPEPSDPEASASDEGAQE